MNSVRFRRIAPILFHEDKVKKEATSRDACFSLVRSTSHSSEVCSAEIPSSGLDWNLKEV